MDIFLRSSNSPDFLLKLFFQHVRISVQNEEQKVHCVSFPILWPWDEHSLYSLLFPQEARYCFFFYNPIDCNLEVCQVDAYAACRKVISQHDGGTENINYCLFVSVLILILLLNHQALACVMCHYDWFDIQEFGRLVTHHSYNTTDAMFGSGRGRGLRSDISEDIIDWLKNLSNGWGPGTRVNNNLFTIYNYLANDHLDEPCLQLEEVVWAISGEFAWI